MEHARNYLTANVASAKLTVNHKAKRYDIEGGFTMKWEEIEENAREYEMRDSSGYSIPHTGNRLDMIYSLASKNKISSTRLEAYLQDTYRFQTGNAEKPNLWTLNMGVRLANWSYNKETIISPRISLAMIPGFNEDMTFRLSTGLYYQAPFYKELRDTTTINGRTIVTLNNDIKSQRSIHIVGAFDYRFRMANRPFRFTAEAYYKILSKPGPIQRTEHEGCLLWREQGERLCGRT